MPTALQNSWVSATANAISVGVALQGVPLPGSLIVVFTEYDSGNGNPTITDNLGDAGAWNTPLTAISDSVNSGLLSVHYKIVGTPSGGNKTITMTCALTGNKLIFAGYYYNPSADLSIDGSAVSSANVTATNPTTPAITTTNTPDGVVLGFVMSAIFNPTVSLPWVLRRTATAPFNCGEVIDQITNGATSYTPTWAAASGVYSSIGVAFKRTLTKPELSAHPDSTAAKVGATATFSVTATGTGSITYQWSKYSGGSWSTIGGATSASYTTGTLAAADNGTLYRCAVTDTLGTITTDQAILNVNNPGANIWRRGRG
jgi:hypothetical protein